MRDGNSIISYFFGRAFAADLLTLVLWLFYFQAILPGFLALSTFHPFDTSLPAFAAVALASALFAFAFARFARLRRRLLSAFGWEPVEKSFHFPPLTWTSRALGAAPGTWRLRLLLPLAATALLPPALALLLLGATHLGWHARFAALASAAGGRGLPVTLAVFADGLPPQAYAYAGLERALEKFDDRALRDEPYRKTSLRRWDKARCDAADRLAARYAGFLDAEFLPLLRGAAGFRPVDYRLVSRDPDALPSFLADKYFRVARLLRLGALARACRGDLPGAWRRLEDLLLLSDVIALDRSLEVKLVALSLRGQAAETALTALLNAPGAALPERLAARLGALQAERLVKDGVGYELARKLDLRRAYELPIITGRKKVVDLGGHGHGGKGRGAHPQDREEELLNLGARLLTLAGAYDAGHYKAAEYLAGQAQDENRPYESVPRAERWPLWPYTIAHFEWPQFTGFYLKELEFRAWARIALLASALERGRGPDGKYPASLAGLHVPGAPEGLLADPTSGKPLEYTLLPGGVAYSLCARGRDGDRKNSDREEFCFRR